MNPLAWAARLPPRDERPRSPPTRPKVPRTVSSNAPRPDVRLLPPLYARVLLGLAISRPYPEQRGVSWLHGTTHSHGPDRAHDARRVDG